MRQLKRKRVTPIPAAASTSVYILTLANVEWNSDNYNMVETLGVFSTRRLAYEHAEKHNKSNNTVLRWSDYHIASSIDTTYGGVDAIEYRVECWTVDYHVNQ